jgi:hypothetical protein
LRLLVATVVAVAFGFSAVPAIAEPGAFTLTGTPSCFSYTPSVLLQWTSSSGATSYELVRDDGQHTAIPKGSLNTFDRDVVVGGPAHAYFVRASDGGSIPTDSNTVTVAPPATQCSPPPVPFTISGNAYCYPGDPARTIRPAIYVHWSSVLYATSYEVYRNGVSAGTFQGGSGGYSLSDLLNPGGLTFTYYVIARNAAGTATSNSVVVFAPADICATSPPVTVLSGSASCGTGTQAPTVTLQWASVFGAGGWRLYRDGELYASLPFTDYYVDTSVVAGHTYTYSIATNGISAPQSNTITVSVCGPGAFSVTPQVFCNDTASAVRLTWTSSPNAGSYTITRDSVTLASGLTNTTYIDTSVRRDTAYSYRVIAVNNNGSTPTASARVLVGAEVCPPTPVTLMATPSCNRRVSPPAPLVTLNWSSAATAVSYLILRSGVQIASVGASTTSFSDTGTSPALAYDYVIRAVGPGGSTDSNKEFVVIDPSICDGSCIQSCATNVATTAFASTAVHFALQQQPDCEANVSWNFGDGTTSGDLTALHSYTSAGQFHWSVTVSLGTNESCQRSGTITVTDPPAPSKRRAAHH